MAQDSLKAICAASGPFITIFLPARHPGTADLPRAQGLKTILRDAAQELERRRFQGPIDQLLKPLEELAENPASVAGGSDSVIFVCPGLFRHFGLPAPTSERLIVASHPHIIPVLAHLMPQQEFYVLASRRRDDSFHMIRYWSRNAVMVLRERRLEYCRTGLQHYGFSRELRRREPEFSESARRCLADVFEGRFRHQRHSGGDDWKTGLD